MDDIDKLTDKQARIIQRVAHGETWPTAAKAQRCSASYARVIRTRMKKNPAVIKALEAIRAEGRTLAAYDFARAMQEAQEVIDFAKLNKNAMAYFKAVEHRAKLNGLLIDKVEVVTVDLKGALTEARSRVLTTVDITPRYGFVAASAVLTGTAQPSHKDAVFGE
jgi:hypothetical protein